MFFVQANTFGLATLVQIFAQKGCKYFFFQIKLGSPSLQWLGLCQMSCVNPFSVFVCWFVFFFKTSPHVLQLFRRLL